MKLLIAEDDLVSRNFLSKFLEAYGEIDTVVDGLETLDAFLMALKEGKPYELIFLDIMMPKVDGIKTLKAIRDLERQYGVAQENRVKIIMTTALAEAQIVRTAFEYGCEVYASKPIDTKKLVEALEKIGVRSMEDEVSYEIVYEEEKAQEGYFKQVFAGADYQLEVIMETGTTIHFDFRSRLNTVRYGMLKDEELFRSVHTDGNYLIFKKTGRMPVKITASEFMDLVLIDRRK